MLYCTLPWDWCTKTKQKKDKGHIYLAALFSFFTPMHLIWAIFLYNSLAWENSKINGFPFICLDPEWNWNNCSKAEKHFHVIMMVIFPSSHKGMHPLFFWENATEIDKKCIIFKYVYFCFLSFVVLIYFYLTTRTYWSDYSDLMKNLFKGRF